MSSRRPVPLAAQDGVAMLIMVGMVGILLGLLGVGGGFWMRHVLGGWDWPAVVMLAVGGVGSVLGMGASAVSLLCVVGASS